MASLKGIGNDDKTDNTDYTKELISKRFNKYSTPKACEPFRPDIEGAEHVK